MRENEQTPDRRPLVYGIFAVAILLVAAFLFWPQGEKPTDLVLTPESMRSGVEDADRAGTGQPGDLGDLGAIGTGEPTRLTTDAGPVVETHIDGTPVESAQQSPTATSNPSATTETVKPSTSKPQDQSTPKPTTSERTSSSTSSLTQPGTKGEWVLNCGAFSSRANADRQVQQLSRLGISAHVQTTSKDDGSPLFRVRVGFFPTSNAAKSYGEWLKRSQDIDSWAAKR
jgi:DedD protein